MDGDRQKLAAARERFVERGLKLTEIALDLDISIFTLDRLRREERWDDLRAQYLESLEPQKELEPNSLNEHKRFIRDIWSDIKYLRAKLTNTEIEERERKEIRASIAALRDLMEAADRLIESDRKVNGVKPSAPSEVVITESDEGIRYNVIIDSSAVEKLG